MILPDRPVLAAVDVRGGSPFTVNTATLRSEQHRQGAARAGAERRLGLRPGRRGRPHQLARGARPRCAICEAAASRPCRVRSSTISPMAATRPGARCRPIARSRCEAARSLAPDSRWAMPARATGPWPAGSRAALAPLPRSIRSTGVTVAALVAVNPVGSVTMPGNTTMWAWHLEQAGELGGQTPPTVATGHRLETKDGIADNTTIGVIATDAALDQGQLRRLAVMAQDGYAYAVRPIHTHLDGDVVFALTTAPAPLAQTADSWSGWVPSLPTSWRARSAGGLPGGGSRRLSQLPVDPRCCRPDCTDGRLRFHPPVCIGGPTCAGMARYRSGLRGSFLTSRRSPTIASKSLT